VTGEFAFVFALLATTIALFVINKIRMDVGALLATQALILTAVVDRDHPVADPDFLSLS
jgi:hypothetical protein